MCVCAFSVKSFDSLINLPACLLFTTIACAHTRRRAICKTSVYVVLCVKHSGTTQQVLKKKTYPTSFSSVWKNNKKKDNSLYHQRREPRFPIFFPSLNDRSLSQSFSFISPRPQSKCKSLFFLFHLGSNVTNRLTS